MRIALDGMGGDLAPQEAVLGGAQAARDLAVEVVVVGLPERLQPLLEAHPELYFVPASQVIEMDDHPAQAVRRKPDSSMSVCARLAKQGRVDGWVSAGNSGGIMAQSCRPPPSLRFCSMSGPTWTPDRSIWCSSLAWAASTQKRFSADRSRA